MLALAARLPAVATSANHNVYYSRTIYIYTQLYTRYQVTNMYLVYVCSRTRKISEQVCPRARLPTSLVHPSRCIICRSSPTDDAGNETRADAAGGEVAGCAGLRQRGEACFFLGCQQQETIVCLQLVII